MERPLNLAAAIEAAAGALVGVLDQAGSRHSVSVPPTQLRVLSIISQRPGTNVNRLAELLDVVPSSASRLCDRLEATGLLRRVADPRDRREVHLAITPAAEELLRELTARRHRALQAVLDQMPHRTQHELLLALLAFGQAASLAEAAVTATRPDRTARPA